MGDTKTYTRGWNDVSEKNENPSQCIRKVSDHAGWHYFQCSRKRGHGPCGLFCKQHAKKVEKSQGVTE